MHNFIKSKWFIVVLIFLSFFLFFNREDNKQDETSSRTYSGNVLKFYDSEFTGECGNGKEYFLSAKEAQSFGPDQYKLNEVRMSYDIDSKGDLSLLADRGLYNKTKQVFEGIGNVKINFQDEYFMFTNKLYARLSDKIIYTNDNVDVKGEGLFLNSKKGVKIDTEKKTIDYHGPIYSKIIES